MKIKLLPAVIASLLSVNAYASNNDAEQQYFKATSEEVHQNIVNKIEDLRRYASDDNNVIVENGTRKIEVNGVKYALTDDNYISFDIPKPFNNETAFRNVFDFIDTDWELTWYHGGMVAVNKVFGNYDYGNGCLMEYYPKGTVDANGPTHVLLETASCSVNDFETTQQYFSNGTFITAEQLGIDSLAITAIERYQDKLFITQDTNPAFITIFDMTTQSVIGRIEGIDSDRGFQPYNRINELAIHNNLLYVSSLSSNRVDIFDLDNNNSLVVSLGSGTGSWGGANGLVHAQSSAATDDFVFVTDAQSRISVYRQQNLTPENPDFAKRAGFLAYEGKYTHRKVQMHTIGDHLIVATADRGYFVYDMTKVDQALADGADLAAEKVVSLNLQKVDLDNNTLVVSFKDRIEWHDAAAFAANGFVFGEPLRTVRAINGQPVSALKDLHFANNELITANRERIAINYLLNNEITFVADTSVAQQTIAFDQLMPTSVTQILGNDEPHHVLMDRELRSVNINSLVQTKLLNNETVQITNYAAKELRDITPELKLNGINKWFKLGTLDRIPAYAQITLPLSAFSSDFQFNSANNDGVFDLSDLFAADLEVKDLFEHRFSSESDAFAQTLSRLKPTWEIRFAGTADHKWRDMNGLYAREWLIIMTNFAYMVSSDEFKHVWFNFEDIIGYNMHSYAGQVHEPGGYFTAEDYNHYYHSMLKRPFVNVGITAMGGGLGSGGITGVDTWLFYSHYYGQWGIIAHEFGHGFDGKSYGHGTSFANGGNGWQPLMTMMANYHIRKGDLPYMDDNLNGFYKEENDAYQYADISLGKRKHRSDSHMYLLDEYFMTFSDLPQGWFQHEDRFAPESLNNQERMMLAKMPIHGDDPYLCRFDYTTETGTTQLHGYVEQLDDQQYRCTGGDEISYRQPNGEKVAFASPVGEFEWLSLYSPEQKGERVTTLNSQELCAINKTGFYGVGFVNSGNQCTQQPEVYWSNGKQWTFSSGWVDYKFR
ncbi:hypothetical protein ABT56_06275 [Photobacterium aquae]|uniref:ToxR activated gene A lipoprotein domain-containing protein n=1 Tax=Photobacterium aquae TaxID=1195763 RepID=A0A0J1JXZ1_9GAMM|nr:hypothetical protein [Photobacterium aquae]KLV07152.1 hypothetical protein ABT56_06275 [Photobacterium aquae]